MTKSAITEEIPGVGMRKIPPKKTEIKPIEEIIAKWDRIFLAEEARVSRP